MRWTPLQCVCEYALLCVSFAVGGQRRPGMSRIIFCTPCLVGSPASGKS